MTANQNYLPENCISNLIDHFSSVLTLSFDCIRDRYKDYPICLMEYIEKEVRKKLIEIRFDKEQVALTCTFDKNEICETVHLFTDREAELVQLTSYLARHYTYNYLRCHWEVMGNYLKVTETKDPYDRLCLMLF